MPAGGRRQHGSLEALVLSVLQRSPRAATAAEVRERLNEEIGDDLAYSTIVTVLSRLHAKGLLERVKYGRAFGYLVVSDQSRITARRLQRLLDSGPDRDAVLAHFVGGLSTRDATLLRRLVGDETDERS